MGGEICDRATKGRVGMEEPCPPFVILTHDTSEGGEATCDLENGTITSTSGPAGPVTPSVM